MKTIIVIALALALPLSAKTGKLDLPGARAEIYKKASGDDLYLYLFEPERHDAAEDFKEQMEKVGLKSELHVYEGQPHGFFNESKGGTENFLDTLRKTDEFLTALGYLEGKPDEAAMKAVCKGK